MSSVRIQSADFDPGAECAALTEGSHGTGAVVTFVGIVRVDGALSAMTIEHYPGFAEREIMEHVADVQRRWPVSNVRVVHRTGRLIPGDRIVFAGVTAPHRGEAFAAAEFLMDYLKTRAPFWKLEERSGGTAWVEAKPEDDAAVKRWR